MSPATPHLRSTILESVRLGVALVGMCLIVCPSAVPARAGEWETGRLASTVASSPTAPLITCDAPPDAVIGEPYSFRVTATGSPEPTISLLSPAPEWVAVDAVTGLVSGIPSDKVDVFTQFTVVATNGVTPAAQALCSIRRTGLVDGWHGRRWAAAGT
jgi:hypothetical protein